MKAGRTRWNSIEHLVKTRSTSLAAVFCLLAATPWLAADVDVTSVTPRTTQYILDRDAGTARDYDLLKGTVAVRYTGPRVSRSTRVRLALLDDLDQSLALETGTNLTSTYNPGALADGQVVDHTFDFALDPAARLDPERIYRVRAQFEEYVQNNPPLPGHWLPNLSATLDSAARRYYHFTNTAASDPQHNVIAVVESISYTRAWRIATTTGTSRNFGATASIRLVRYDDPGEPGRDDLLDFDFLMELRDGANVRTGLSSPRDGIVGFSQQMSTKTGANLPYEAVRTLTISFSPLSQLDSVNSLYQLRGEVWAEPAPRQTEQRLAGGSSAAQGLLDFNGSLSFGSDSAAVTAVMTGASRTASPIALLPIGAPNYASVELNVSALSVSGSGASFSGSPGVIVTRLLSSGLATYNSTTPLTLSNPVGNVTQTVAQGGVNFLLNTQISLSSSGATAASLSVPTLPAGMGVSFSASPPAAGEMLRCDLDARTSVPLNASLAPLGTVTWTFGGDRWVMEESKPLLLRVSAIHWNPVLARFDLTTTGDVHHPEAAMRQILAASPTTSPELPDREKRSNNDAWLLATGVSTTTPASIRQSPPDGTPNSNAALSAEFLLSQGSFRSHFPEANVIANSANNRIRVADDFLVPANSYLDGARVELSYLAGDPDAAPSACGGAASATRFIIVAPANASSRLGFTATGGLHATCASIPASGHELKWGSLGGTQFAFATDPFQQFTFYMPGTFYPQVPISSGDSDLAHQFTPIPIHLVGYVAGKWRFSDMEATSTPEYRDNSLRADYAGANARVASEAAGFKGSSIIAGQNAGSYPLTSESRYYVRKSGVTGIHDALGGPTSAVLYGFPATFFSYGFSFRDNRVTHSVTNGGLAVPYPSDFALELENIRFSATGRPLDARLPSSLAQLTLKYWNCRMTPTALAFSSTDPCDVSQGLLRIQAGVEMPNLGQTLHGELGFRDDGHIATHAASGLTSRLKAPSHITLRGPQKTATETEHYTLTPVTDVYLNNYADHPSATPLGFLNVAGKLDVAFFQDLEVHVQTTAGIPGQEGAAPLYVTGGWTAPDGKNYFNDSAGFDSNNRGFPSGVTLDNYRTGADYRPVARRTWLDAIDFEYPLLWDNGARTFRSPDDFDGDVDLIVANANHQLVSLSAEQASLRFGLTYDGLPQINLGSMLVNAVDEATGAFAAIEEALGQAAGAALLAGSDAMAGLLNDSADEIFGPVIERELGPAVNLQVLNPLALPAGNPHALPAGSLKPQSEWAASLQTSLTNPSAWLQLELPKLGSNGTTPPVYVTEITAMIDDAIEGIDVFVGPDGLLALDSNGNYAFASDLVFYLIDMLADEELKTLLGIKRGTDSEAAFNAKVTLYINQYAPALNTIRSRLEQIKGQLEQVKGRLNVGQELANFIGQRFTAPEGSAELQALAELLSQDIIAHLEANYAANPEAFALPANRDATSAFIIRRIRDRMAAGAIALHLQTVLRQQLQDLQAGIDQTIGSVFSNINRIIRELVADVAGNLDEAISPLNGLLGSVAGAGSIDGEAVIRGDELDHLRLDLQLQLELDEPMTFQGFLEINRLESNGGREIKVGAIAVPIEMFGSTADFTVIGRVNLDSGNSPTDIGGSIEMVDGSLQFESFKISTLGASIMFGATENYLAAKLGMEFQSFRVAGGIFVGHSDDLEPLAMIDPAVAGVIPAGSITGVYVYGEVFMPIVDFGCLFRVSAGLGIGAFYFAEGPIYGGKIYAAVSGKALCLLQANGEVTLIGVKSDILRFKGTGKVSGKVGYCPFCVTFKKSVSFTYDENNGFDADY